MQAEKLQDIKKGVDVIPIQPKEVENVWHLVHLMTAEALKYSGQYAEPHHVKEMLIKGNMQLFIMYGSEDGETNKVFGCCTTRLFNNPNFKELQGLICTGTKMHLWESKLIETLESFAKLNDCKRINALMRPGYKKVMPKYGYKIKHYEFQKELN